MEKKNETVFQAQVLSRESPVPLYYQLKEVLRSFIESAEAGSELPTESDLCEMFSISRSTVRQAIRELEYDGYVTREKGRGTFTFKPKLEQDFLVELKSFHQEMQEKGLRHSTKLLQMEKATPNEKICNELRLPRTDTVLVIERLRFIEAEPFVVVTTYVPVALAPGLVERHLEDESLYDVLEQNFGYSIQRAERHLEARIIASADARLLRVGEGTAIQWIETTTFLESGRPIEHSIARYRGDMSRFSFELRKRRSE